eukprot:8219624-Alexandrium_andersonii.AAC.1
MFGRASRVALRAAVLGQSPRVASVWAKHVGGKRIVHCGAVSGGPWAVSSGSLVGQLPRGGSRAAVSSGSLLGRSSGAFHLRGSR